jgi:SP family facilitated glucose transporter-like MFS transporter 1
VEAIGAIIAALSKLTNSFEMMGAGRFVIGLGFGIGCGAAALLISELAPNPKVRGAIGTTQQILIGCGQAAGFIFTLPQIFGTYDLWPIAVVLPAVPAIIQTFIMLWAHDSPKFLLWTAKNRVAAEKSLNFYKGTKAILFKFT